MGWMVLLLLGVVGACTPDERPASEEQSAPVADEFATVRDWATQAAHQERSPAEAPGNARLERVEITEKSGYDRVAFTFREAALPGYTIRYAERPIRQCGSGRPVELAGNARLEVQFAGAQAHTQAGTSTLSARALTERHPAIREAVLTCDFEGRVVWGLGLAERSAYRILRDTTAGKIAIDVRHR